MDLLTVSTISAEEVSAMKKIMVTRTEEIPALFGDQVPQVES